MRPKAKALFEVGVNRNDIKSIVERHQDADDYPISDQVSHYHLKISKANLADIARNRNECNAGEGRADHSKRHQVPRRLTIRGKEGIGVGPFGGDVGNQDERPEVNRHDCKYQNRAHSLDKLICRQRIRKNPQMQAAG